MDVLQWFDLRWRECGKLDQSRIDRYKEDYKRSPGFELGAGRLHVADGTDVGRAEPGAPNKIVVVQRGKRPPPAVEGSVRGSPAKGQVTVAGMAYDYRSAAHCLVLVIEELQRQDPGFLELCWKDSRFRRAERTHFIARAKEKLGTEHFQSEAREMDNGWWLSMQTQTQKKWELLEAAADIAKMV